MKIKKEKPEKEKTNSIWNKLKGRLENLAAPSVFAILFYIAVAALGNRSLCFIRNLYGVPCPGCGLTRSYLSLFRGDIGDAFHYHPLFILPVLIFMVILLKTKSSLLSRLYSHRSFWPVIAIGFISVWAIRMLLLFPNEEPMTFNRNALLPVILKAAASSFGIRIF